MRKAAIVLLFAVIAFGQYADFESIYGIGINIEAKVDPRNGLYSVGLHEDGTALTYGFDLPWSDTCVPYSVSNCFSVKIDDEVYRSHSFWSDDTTAIDLDSYILDTEIEDSILVTRWAITTVDGDVIVEQRLWPMEMDHDPVIEVEYNVNNMSYTDKWIGIKTFVCSDSIGLAYVGSFYTDTGIIMEPDDPKPDFFTFFRPIGPCGTDPEDKYLRCYLNHSGDCWACVGEYAEISRKPWDIVEEDYAEWDSLYMGGSVQRWDEQLLLTYTGFTCRTYVGQGESMVDSSFLEIHINRYYSHYFHHLDCVLDTIKELRYTVTSSAIEPFESLIICISAPDIPFIELIGLHCDTLFDMGYLDAAIITRQLKIDPGMGRLGPINIPLTVESLLDIPCAPEAIFADTLTVPYYDPGPYVERHSEVDDTHIAFHIADSMSLYRAYGTIVTYRSGNESFTPEDVLVSGDSVVCPTAGNIVTETGDTVVLDSDFEICIDMINDMDCNREQCFPIFPVWFEIHTGWNLLSFPDEVSLPGGIPPAYTFDTRSGSYEEAEHVRPEKGFWWLSDVDTTIVGPNIVDPMSVQWWLYPGWNLVGAPNHPVPVSDLPLGLLAIDEVYTYDSELRTYITVDIIEPGRGYFVLADMEIAFSVGN